MIVVLLKCMLSMMSDGILSQVEVGGLLHVYLMLLVMPIDFLKRSIAANSDKLRT